MSEGSESQLTNVLKSIPGRVKGGIGMYRGEVEEEEVKEEVDEVTVFVVSWSLLILLFFIL
jgi:hypothetical protein